MKIWDGKAVAIVPAGGMGKRIGGAIPKQFLLIQGKPILIHTLEKLDRCDFVDEIILAIPESYIPETGDLLNQWNIRKVFRIVAGGKERQDSVANALEAVDTGVSLVFTHDAVRPLISCEKIGLTLQKAWQEGAAVLGVREKCTIKRAAGSVILETVDRSGLWQMQTPQAFRIECLKEAYASAKESGLYGTDDAMLVERLNHPVHIVEGDDTNIKITTLEDLVIAEAILGKKSL